MKPILFNTDMVKAILDGHKTVTRRVVKPHHIAVLDSQYHREHPWVPDKLLLEKLCQPPYQPGDVLYVREAWARGYIECSDAELCNERWFEPNYREPIPDSYIDGITAYFYRADFTKRDERELHIVWRPSIYMPREAARIFLLVKDVRVEQLQDIKISGMIAEGVIPKRVTGGVWKQLQRDYMKPVWESTIKPADREKYGWDANPWVWVVSFEQISKEEAMCK